MYRANKYSQLTASLQLSGQVNGVIGGAKSISLCKSIKTMTFRKTAHPMHSGGGQGWEPTTTADTLNIYDNSEARTPIVVVSITQDTDDMQNPK